MNARCCNCALWFSFDDGYGFCECDGKIRFCDYKCSFVSPPEEEGETKDEAD